MHDTSPCLILSPCGTSTLTNRSDQELRGLLIRHANVRSPEEVPEAERALIEAHIAARGALFETLGVEEASKMSAELNALMRLYEGDPASRAQPDVHWLVTTDTWLGQATGELIGAWLRRHGKQVLKLDPIGGLRTDNLESFQTAMSDLALQCGELLPGWQARGYRVVFNLTGGFKSIQGFLQTLAMLYADETVYIFENRSDLLRIPRLPVRLDTASHLRQHAAVFRRLAIEGQRPASEAQGVAESLLTRVDDQVGLSAWGQVAWSDARTALYAEGLLDSPDPERVVYGPDFEASTRRLSPAQYIQLNTRIDDLTRYLQGGEQQPLRRLDYKKLKGDPCPPSTHEIDAWADADVQRVFLHRDGPRAILDRLGAALH